MRRDLTRLALIREQIEAIEQARVARLEQAPQTGPNAMIRMLASIRGVGIETAEMLVQEVLSRNLRDQRAVGRAGSPVRRMKADPSDVRKVSPSRAMLGCAAARAQRWYDTVAGLVALQAEYAAWHDALPDSLRDSTTAESLQAIVDLHPDALIAIVPPRGYGRD
jgi:hypothetical protein